MTARMDENRVDDVSYQEDGSAADEVAQLQDQYTRILNTTRHWESTSAFSDYGARIGDLPSSPAPRFPSWSNSLFAFMGKDTRVLLSIRFYLIVVPPRPSVVNRSLSTSWVLNLLAGVSRSRTAMAALNFPWVRSRSRCLLAAILKLWSRFNSSTWMSLILSLVWT